MPRKETPRSHEDAILTIRCGSSWLHGRIFPRIPVVRLDPAEGSVSSRGFLSRDVTHTGTGACVHRIHTRSPAWRCCVFNYGGSRATDAVKRRLVDFLGREDAFCLPRLRRCVVHVPRPRRRANSLRAGEKRDFDIYSAVRAGRPAKTPGDSQSWNNRLPREREVQRAGQGPARTLKRARSIREEEEEEEAEEKEQDEHREEDETRRKDERIRGGEWRKGAAGLVCRGSRFLFIPRHRESKTLRST